MKKWKSRFLPLLLAMLLAFSGCSAAGSPDAANAARPEQTQAAAPSEAEESAASTESESAGTLEFSSDSLGTVTVPAYSGQAYTAINDNIPFFNPADYEGASFETYGDLDDLGRCTGAIACVGTDLMPTEERGSISQVRPSGWQTAEYDIVDGGYLYNRCHLIGYQLTAENANELNLITGTRYMNVDGMLPFENMVADYVKETENHVLYRVTPLFSGDDLVARGVLMEGWSVEDEGEGICFNVFVYNIQPGITIDYSTGGSALSGDTNEGQSTGNEASGSEASAGQTESTYILNTNTLKFHLPSCASAADIKEENRETFTGSREELIAEGYSPCGNCSP